MSGTVRLYNIHDILGSHIEQSYFYSDPTDRKRMIEIWKRRGYFEYGDHFIQIAPDVNLTGRSAVHLKKAI